MHYFLDIPGEIGDRSNTMNADEILRKSFFIKKRKNRLLYITMMLVWFLSLSVELAAQQAGQDAKGLAREHYYQGVFFGKQQKYTEAQFELEKAIELYPAYADAYNALAVIFHRQNMPAKAIEQYLLAIEMEPGHVKARTNLAMMYHEQREYEKSLRQLEKALEIDANYAPASKLLAKVQGKVSHQIEQQAPQIQTPQKAAAKPATSSNKKGTQSTQSLFERGTLLIRQGKIDAGIQAYRIALKRSPHSVKGQTLLGMAYREKYRVTYEARWQQQAFSLFSNALKRDSSYVPALLGLGEVYYERGFIFKALASFRQALQLQPNHPAKDQLEAAIYHNE